MKITHGFIGPRNAQIFSLNNAQILIWPPDYHCESDQYSEPCIIWQYHTLIIVLLRLICEARQCIKYIEKKV